MSKRIETDRTTQPVRGSARDAFTLIELLMVLAILLVLAGLVVPKLAGRQKAASIDATKVSLEGLAQAIQLYSVDHHGDLPASNDGLVTLVSANTRDPDWRGPYLKEIPVDAWGQPFEYKLPGTQNPDGFDLISSGPDRLFGTDDDIGNWK